MISNLNQLVAQIYKSYLAHYAQLNSLTVYTIRRRTTILLTVTWGVIQMSYDGHIRCLNNLGMNMFVTFTIASATEFPAEMLLIYLLDVLGRRWSLFGAVILAGLFSLCAASVSIGVAYASLAICSRLFISVSSNIAMQYAAELLPTVVRGEGVSLIHVTGYITSILSPFIAFSSNLMYNLPMIILGVSSVFAGTLCLFLPETLMEQLPQTIMVTLIVVVGIIDAEFFVKRKLSKWMVVAPFF